MERHNKAAKEYKILNFVCFAFHFKLTVQFIDAGKMVKKLYIDSLCMKSACSNPQTRVYTQCKKNIYKTIGCRM